MVSHSDWFSQPEEPPPEFFDNDQDAPKCSSLIANSHIEAEKTVPHSMEQILEDIKHATGGQLSFAVGGLFVPNAKRDGVEWLPKAASLLGWLGSVTGQPPQFSKSTSCHSTSEVFEEIKRTAPRYDAIESFAHEPPFEKHYYACKIPEPGDGLHLDDLVSRFCPATDIDSDLIKLLFVTMIWGGLPGTRPAFLITADGGRGHGKSKLIELGAEIVGGALSLSMNENEAQIKQRLLSNEGVVKRVVILDNIKTNRFSWGGLEALITSSSISGKRMYYGEASRPNNVLWCMTMNGASLSKDIAQRSVIIKLAKPKRSGAWLEDTRQFILQNREQIIADCIGFLRGKHHTLERYSRWGTWEKDVLEMLPNAFDVQQTILERQEAADTDTDEAGLIAEHFERQLTKLQYDTTSQQVFIPSAIAAEWYNAATNEREKTITTSKRLQQLIDEGSFNRLVRNSTNSRGRGFIWIGPNAVIEEEVNTDIEARVERQCQL